MDIIIAGKKVSHKHWKTVTTFERKQNKKRSHSFFKKIFKYLVNCCFSKVAEDYSAKCYQTAITDPQIFLVLFRTI